MKLIKIINGTYGFRPQPYVVELKTADDQPFEVSDEEADRLIGLGVAALAFGDDSESLQVAMDGMVGQLEDQPVPPEDPDEDPEDQDTDEPEDEADETNEPAPAAEKMDPEELKQLTNPELGELAKELGIEVKGRPTKADLIDAIMAAAAEDDELPDLGAADPEV
ncbi:MAG: Rho termination factor N-terminal domain-containing protein [Paludibacteraceae bacterium]|nr:Rho termination factor N-terminal domain-containing protein [Paludibacteraceae bacterium]